MNTPVEDIGPVLRARGLRSGGLGALTGLEA
jgi:hypothetical protein